MAAPGKKAPMYARAFLPSSTPSDPSLLSLLLVSLLVVVLLLLLLVLLLLLL